MRGRSKKKDFIIFYKNYLKTKSFFNSLKLQNTSSSFIYRLRALILKKKKLISANSPVGRAGKKDIYVSISKPIKKKSSSFKNKIKKQAANFVFAKQIKGFLQKIFKSPLNYSFKKNINISFSSISVFRPFIQLQFGRYIFSKFNKVNNSKKIKLYTFQIKIYSKRLYKFITIFLIINQKKDLLFSDNNKLNYLFFYKLHQYQKIAFSLRLRKAFLPRSKNLKIKKSSHGLLGYIRPKRMRQKMLRFSIKQRKKHIRGKKYIRRKSVHFFIPSYLQIDFRTLRAVKRQSPSLEDIYYSFRISLPKVYSFYRAKGF